MKRKFLTVILFSAIALFTFSTIASQLTDAASYTNGIGTIKYYEEREIANGLVYSSTISQSWGWQRGHQLEFNPQTAGVEIRSAYGPSIYGGDNMTAIVNHVESSGEIVFAAFNGDFYEISTGIPSGIIIRDGRILTGVNGNNSLTVGFTAEGGVVIAQPRLALSYSLNGGSNKTINRLNKSHLTTTNNVFLHTPEFGATTKSSVNSTEVVLQVESGDLTFGSVITTKVIAVNVNAKDTAIGANQLVLSAESFADSFSVGDEVKINVSETTGQFSGVREAISGNSTLLVANGERNPALDGLSDLTAFHPRTSIGVKADGTVVVHLNDGRQPGFSEGLTDRETADYMVSQGCVTAVRLDGGGSSTMHVRFPGDTETSLVNSPSDLQERSNSNAMVLVAKVKTAGEFAKLHAYPGKISALENTVIDLKVLATDANFLKVATPNLTYYADPAIGTVDANGTFTATSGTASGVIEISSGDVVTTIEVDIVDGVDELYLDQNNLPLGLGEVVMINATAYYQGMLIQCSNESFKWELNPSQLGTITNKGVFTSGQTAGVKGKILVSYKDVVAEVIVTVGELPILIEDFETAVVANQKGCYGVRHLSGAKGSIAINTDERYVKFGNASLKVDFDHTQATGTGATEVYQCNAAGAHPSIDADYIQVEGRPSHVGMWVYATESAQGAWLRLQYRAGNGGAAKYITIADSVNWTGWKYVEAEVAANETMPFRIQFIVRVLSTKDTQRIKGTIYVDGIRAVYGFRDDDMVNPTISNVTPEDGAKITNPEPVISAELVDTGTGINRDKTRMWINGVEMEGLTFNNITNGYRVNYVPSVFTKLTPGSHRIKLRTEDFFGNFTIKEWTINVNADTVSLSVVKPDVFTLYSGELGSYIINVDKYDNFEKYDLELSYNNKTLEILGVSVPEGVEIISKVVDDVNGKIYVTIQGMNYLGMQTEQLVKVDFRVKLDFEGEAEIKVVKSVVKDTKISSNVNIFIEDMAIISGYKYVTQYTGGTINRMTTVKVVEGTKGISGATILTKAGIVIPGTTGANGTLETDLLTQYPIGTKIIIYAEYNGIYAQPIEFTVVDSLGTIMPDFVIIAAGQDPSTEMHFGWMTHLSVTDTMIRYAVKGTDQFTELTSDDIEIIMIAGREIMSHHISIYGLLPNTTYVYQVGDGTNFSEFFEFRTAQQPGSDFSFLYFSDPQASSAAGYDPLVKIYQEALKMNPNITMAVASGDISDNGNNWQYWNYFYEKMGDYVTSIPTVYGSGNHETPNMPMFNALFNNPGNGIESLKGSNYYIDLGNVIIAVIDSEAIDKIEEQRQWLINVMDNSDAAYKIVMMHRGPYSIYYSHQAFTTLNSTFELLGIDLVLTGHDHIYNRTVNNGVTYVVGGSSGTKFYDNTVGTPDWPVVIYDDNYPVFGMVDVTSEKLVFTMYALVGSEKIVIDSFEIAANNEDNKYLVVMDLISGLGEITIDSEAKIEYARLSYDNLDPQQQALVANYQVLLNAEARLAEIKADHAAANQVIALIDAIGEVTLGSKAAIEAARAAYDSLNANALLLVTNSQDLVDAEAVYALLLLQQASIAQVIDLIDAIGEVTLDSQAAITAARTAYDALSVEDQALVTNYQDLVDAEAAYLGLVNDQVIAAAVVDMIAQLGTIDLTSGDTLAAVRAAYNALTPSQQSFVTNYNLLVSAEELYQLHVEAKALADTYTLRIAALQNATIDDIEAVITLVEEIIMGNPLALQYIEGFEEFNLNVAIPLTLELTFLVANVSDLIDAIGEVTKDSKDAIITARAAYEALPEYGKNLISEGHQILVAAEAAFDALNKTAKSCNFGSSVISVAIFGIALIGVIIRKREE